MKRAEFIELWTKELESGEYQQIEGELRRSNRDGGHGYCCLGVACHIAERENAARVNWTEEWNELLPQSMVRLLGITDNGSFNETVEHRGESYPSLVAMNDAGIHFKTIARIIREQMAKGNFEKP